MMSNVGIRLAFMMVLALLPLGLISISQTQNLIRAGESAALNVVMGETVSASADLVTLISDSQAMVRTLAVTVAPYSDDLETCERMMRAAAMLVPLATLVAYIPRDGVMACTNTGTTFNFNNSPIFDDLVAHPEPRTFITSEGPVSGEPVLGLTHPVILPNQEYAGVVSVSLPQAVLAPSVTHSQGEAFFLFNRTGTILSTQSSVEAPEAFLPKGRSLAAIAGGGSRSFIAEDRSGVDRMYAVLPVDGDLFFLSSYPRSASAEMGSTALHPYLLPVLMWIVGLAMALLAAERLVARHLRRLSRAMEAFASGERNVSPPPLDNPPSEIAQLASDYSVLIATLLREEASKETLLRQRAELLREVHHRTGNSLQLIASILRMHLREDPDEQTRILLENIHDRVMGLSTVHFGLYRMAGMSDIAMNTLLAEVIGKIGAIHGRYGRKDAITSVLEPLVLQTPQAVPLALLVSEILSAFPAAVGDDDGDTVHVTLRDVTDEGQENTTAELVITGPAQAYDTLKGIGSGVPEIIASRLIRAFVAQLEGSLDVNLSDDNSKVIACIRFGVLKPEKAQNTPPYEPIARTL